MKATLVLFTATIICVFEALSQNGLPPQIGKTTAIYKCMQNTFIQVSATLAAQADAVSDGQGHHYVIQTGSNQIQHYLFNDLGEIVHQATFANNAIHPSITSRNGKIHVALGNQNSNQIELWQSSNGGASWNNALGSRPFDGTLTDIDTYENNRGIHIVYTTNNQSVGTSYRLINPATGWIDGYSRNVNGQSSAGVLPAIIATAESAHVFSNQGMFSFKFPTTGSGTWVLSTPPAVPTLSAAAEIFIAPTGSSTPERHMFLIYASSDFYFSSRRYISSDQWSSTGAIQGGANQGTRPTMMGITQYPFGESPDAQYANIVYDAAAAIFWRRSLVASLGDPGTTVDVVNWHQGTECPPPLGVNPGGAALMGANLGSMAFFWRDDDGTLYFRRKPIGMKGIISDSYAMTDTNWIVGDVTVGDPNNNVELRFKSGSVTYILGEYNVGSVGNPIWRGPGKLNIASGSTIVIESGAKVYLEPPQSPHTVGGALELGDNVVVTIQSGATVEAKPGTKFRFGNGASMSIAGTFKAKGTSYTNQVIFERTGSGTWGGLIFTGSTAGNDTIEYAKISYANPGVRVSSRSTFRLANTKIDNSNLGVELNLAPGDYDPYREIKNCRFDNMTGSGIAANYASNILIDTDTIYNSSGARGIFLNGSSPKILRTRVYDGTYGIECVNFSSPVLEDGTGGGYNKFKNNSNAFKCSNGSDAVFGFISGSFGDIGGQNSFEVINNATIGTATGASMVPAEGCWWGQRDDPGMRLLYDDESFIDYVPWLLSDPNPGASITLGNGRGLPILSPGEDLMREVLQHRAEGQYGQALQKIKTMITSGTVALPFKKWALRQLVAIAHRLPNDRLSDYLGALVNNHPVLLRQIKGVLPNLLQGEGAVSDALAAFTANIQQYPNSEMECAALYGKFLHALYTANNSDAATALKNQMSTRYAESGEAFMAGVQLQNYVQSHQQSLHLALGKPASNNVPPPSFGLSQNYPNPFNPSTSINYAIAVDGHVLLKVYDVLGREVASLVDGFEPSGQHSVTLEASSLATGLYFYRLTAGEYTDVKKLVVMK